MSLQTIQIGVLSAHCENVSVNFQHQSFHTQPPSSLRVRPSDATRADTSRSDLVYHVNALADASNVGENLRWEHPLGQADGIRAVRQTLSIRDPQTTLHSLLRTG